jgi:hypothetical protein
MSLLAQILFKDLGSTLNPPSFVNPLELTLLHATLKKSMTTTENRAGSRLKKINTEKRITQLEAG